MNLRRLALVIGLAALTVASLLVLAPRWQNYQLKANLHAARRRNELLRQQLQQLHDYQTRREAEPQQRLADSVATVTL